MPLILEAQEAQTLLRAECGDIRAEKVASQIDDQIGWAHPAGLFVDDEANFLKLVGSAPAYFTVVQAPADRRH